MKIDAAELIWLKMPLKHHFETSWGRYDSTEHLLVKLFSGNLVGYGECATYADPSHYFESSFVCWHILETYILPELVGAEMDGTEELQRIYSNVASYKIAKTGTEEAFWHLLSLKEGKPLYQLLGGRRKSIESGVSIGIQDSISQLIERMDKFHSQGYKRIKVKIKPGWDVQIIKEIRKTFSDIPLTVDANCAYSPDQIDILKELDRYHLMMIEQPFREDDLYNHALLQSQISTPVCLDEGIGSAEDALQAIRFGSCKVINIKPARVGGLWESKRLHDVCQGEGVPVWCGGKLETGIGRAHNIALSSLPNFSLPGDISGSDRYYDEEIVDPPIVCVKGQIEVPQIPGLGFEVNDERIEKYTVKEAKF